jgi:pyrroloquinoline quinone biosynthesis protein B
VAISADGKAWFLVNASPDLAQQIESFPPLQPVPPQIRRSPIADVLLTNADLDHALGLLLMRQQNEPLIVCATAEVRERLRWTSNLLASFSGVLWRQPPLDFYPLAPGMDFRAIPLTKGDIAYEVRNQSTGKRAVIAPAVGAFSADLQTALNWCDALFIDGTFWSDGELKPLRPNARTATEMGHVPVEQSLIGLRSCRAAPIVYIHINNTNPILAPNSPQRREVEAAGIAVGEDGMEFEL